MKEVSANEVISEEVIEINTGKKDERCKQLLQISCKKACKGIIISIGCIILAMMAMSLILMFQSATEKQCLATPIKIENSNRKFVRSQNSKSFSQSKSLN